MKPLLVLFLVAVATATLSANASLRLAPVDLTPSVRYVEHDSIPADPAPVPECEVTAMLLRGTARARVVDRGSCGSGYADRDLTGESTLGAESTLWVDKGSLVELGFPDGSIVRVGPGTELRIAQLHCTAGDPPFTFELSSGSMWGRLTPAGEEIVMEVETDDATVTVRNATFSVELVELDTVFKLPLTALYPPEYGDMVKQMDSTMRIDVPFKGIVTRVAVFTGSTAVEDRDSYKTFTVDAGKQLLCGLEGIPANVEPIVKGKGFDGEGEMGR